MNIKNYFHGGFPHFRFVLVRVFYSTELPEYAALGIARKSKLDSFNRSYLNEEAGIA